MKGKTIADEVDAAQMLRARGCVTTQAPPRKVNVYNTVVDKLATQNAEFYALIELTKQWNRLAMTPIVDDDYPEIRHYYESALRTFLSACKQNGREFT